MGWDILIALIVQEGLPVAEKLFQKWNNSAVPTQADFDELRELGKQKAVDRMKLAIIASGEPLDSPRSIELLKMAGL